MENIILASQSPRRQEILSLGGYEYKVCVSSAEEQIPPEELENLTPQELVEKLARVKAEDVYRRNCSKNMEKSSSRFRGRNHGDRCGYCRCCRWMCAWKTKDRG